MDGLFKTRRTTFVGLSQSTTSILMCFNIEIEAEFRFLLVRMAGSPFPEHRDILTFDLPERHYYPVKLNERAPAYLRRWHDGLACICTIICRLPSHIHILPEAYRGRPGHEELQIEAYIRYTSHSSTPYRCSWPNAVMGR